MATETRHCETCDRELSDKRWFTCEDCPADATSGLKPAFCRDCIAGHDHESED